MPDFGDIRSIAHSGATPQNWRLLCEALDAASDEEVRDKIIPYLEAHLGEWPETLRVMPPPWYERLARGEEEPRAAIARIAIIAGPDDVWGEGEDDDDGSGDLGLRHGCLSCALAPDLSTMVLADHAQWHRGGGDVLLFDITRGEIRRWLSNGENFHGECYRASYSPCGGLIAIAPVREMTEGHVEVWDAQSKMRLWRQDLVDDTKQEADLASGDEWPSELISIAFDPRSERVAAASKFLGQLNVWSAREGELLAALDEEDGAPLPLAYARDGGVVTGHADAKPTALAFSHDGIYLAVGYHTGHVRIWHIEDAEIVAESTSDDGLIKAISFSRDDTRLVAVAQDVSAWQWSDEQLDLIATYNLAPNPQHVALVARGGDTFRVAYRTGGSICRLDLPRGEERCLALEDDRGEALTLSPDGTWVFYSNTQRARMWRA